MHEQGACRPTPSNHHSRARSVHLAAARPNEPQPRGMRLRGHGNIEQGRASTAGRESNTQGTNRRGRGHHSRRARGEPTATLALRLTCCTREASARPRPRSSVSPPLRRPHTMPSRAKPQSPHVCTGCLRQARRGMGIGPRIRRHCPGTKASNHARGMPRQLPSAGAIKAKNAVPVA